MGLLPPRKFETVRAGSLPGDCEDASWVSYPAGGGPARVVLCDGATESAFARPWAQALARAFIYRPLDLSRLDEAALARWLLLPQDEWGRRVPWQRVPWHGEAKTRSGALSTLLGLELDQTPARSGVYLWQAVAVGDCCLFIVRDNALAGSFPMDDAGCFNDTPSLICSNPVNNAGLWSKVRRMNGLCRSGDRLVLASDALACWILQAQDFGDGLLETLLALEFSQQWEDWLQAKRAGRAIRNDDTTLITIRVE